MNKFMDFLNNKFAPKAQVVGNNQWIVTLKNSVLEVLPFILVGSVVSLLNIPGNFWKWWPDFSPVSNFTFGLLSIFVAFLVPFNYMEFKKLKKQRIIAGLTSVALFLMLINLSLLTRELLLHLVLANLVLVVCLLPLLLLFSSA